MSHKKRIREIFDFAYANSALKTPSRICKEVGKVLHVGMYREEITGEDFGFTFSRSDLRSLNGSSDKVVSEVTSKLRQDFDDMNRHWSIYPKGDKLDLTDEELGFLVGKLDHIHVSNPNADVFGDALEIFRSKWAKQQVGQFFTNQYVTNLAVDLLEFDPRAGDDFVDICAGTGGFLLAALNRIELAYTNGNLDEATVAATAGKALRGFEIDPEITELGNSTLSARLGQYGDSLITCADSLASVIHESYIDRVPKGNYRCMATNPPFGAKVAVRNKQVLKHFELAKLTNSGQAGKSITYPRAPDTLFIERNLKLLAPDDGRVAIVIPYQILSGPQTRYIRDWILRNSYVEAVIDLPQHTFQPHTGTKTALVLLRRRSRPLLNLDGIEPYPVFVGKPRSIGHDRRGNTVYRDSSDGDRVVDTDLPDIAYAFKAFKEGRKLESSSLECRKITGKEFVADPSLRLNARFYLGQERTNVTQNKRSQSKLAKWVKVRDVVDDVFFPGRFKRSYVEKGEDTVPFFGGTNINQWIMETDKYLQSDDPKLDKLKVSAGWILVTRSGTTGIVSMVPQAWDGIAFSEHVIRVVPNLEKIRPSYLHAVLKTKNVQEQLARMVFGSVIDEITPEAVMDLDIPMPSSKDSYEAIVRKLDQSEVARNQFLVDHYDGVSEIEELSTS